MASKFKFRLDPLLRIRQHEEDQRKAALGRVVGRLNEQTARAVRYNDMIRDEHGALRGGGLVGSLDVRRLAHHRSYVNSVMRAMVQTLCERATTQQEARKAQAELVEAVKRRKVLDKLRDRRRSQWLAEVGRTERRDLDEMGVQTHRRNRQEAEAAGASEGPDA
ncbi:MAG: hypothetical protein BIFFINMI_03033 [Phycisphaerae bacterium]|nr:hypothetical protein [Phycisphaerae bacterium]